MKNLKTGDITPPLPHDEYTRAFEAKVEEELAKRNKSAAAKSPHNKSHADKKADDPKKA